MSSRLPHENHVQSSVNVTFFCTRPLLLSLPPSLFLPRSSPFLWRSPFSSRALALATGHDRVRGLSLGNFVTATHCLFFQVQVLLRCSWCSGDHDGTKTDPRKRSPAVLAKQYLGQKTL